MKAQIPMQLGSKKAGYQKAIVFLAVVPIIVMLMSAGTYVYLTKYFKRPTTTLATAVQNTEKRNADLASGSYYIGKSSYKGEISDKSKINKSEFGRLYKISNQTAGVSFITAMTSEVDASKLLTNSGWQIQQIGQDPMWIPGACAQKPSWLLGDRYVVIDDGSYEAGQTTHYYAIYDTQTKKFTHFGGSLVSDTQAHEKIMFVNTENGKLVFYIDLQDSSGQFASSSNFKHSKANKEGYIIRREINVTDLTYDDYRVPYQQPSLDPYYTQVVGNPTSVKLELHTDGVAQYLIGDIKSNQQVMLLPLDPLKLSEVPSLYLYKQDLIKPYQDDVVSYLKNKLPQFSEAKGSPLDKNFGVDFEGIKAGNVFVNLPTGMMIGGIPAVYNTSTHTVELSATTSGLKVWFDAGLFIMGTFKL